MAAATSVMTEAKKYLTLDVIYKHFVWKMDQW